MPKNIQADTPGEMPQPSKEPEIKPSVNPETPQLPDENEPVIIPDENPTPPIPEEIPLPTKEE
jgi:hypothetical protein